MSEKSLKRIKIIRDPVYGYIELDKLALDLINTGAFRRLRWINQHGLAQFVYPGATITRLTHSIGVYHIAKQYFENIIKNTKEEILREIFSEDRGGEIKKEKIEESYRLIGAAALLHDIGHGPFSHASEPVLASLYEDQCINFLESVLGIKDVKLKTHECITCYIIEKNGEINEVFSKYSLNKRDVISVLIGRKVQGSSLNDDQIRVLNHIISSNIDADRLDFVLRDSYFLGVPYGLTDVERIIRVARIEKDDNGNLVLAYDIRGLSAIEHFLFARTHMYRWVFYHHIITLLDTLVLPTAIAFSQEFGCISFPDLDKLAENSSEYPTDYDILKALKCTIEKIRNRILCYSSKNEEIREIKSTEECKDGLIIPSKPIEMLIGSINDRKLLPKSLWKRYEGMVAEISDYISSEIDRKFEECRQLLIRNKQYEALPSLAMQYSSLFRDQYFVFSELNSILGNKEEKKKMITYIRMALDKAGVPGMFYHATRSVKFYDDEKPIYIVDRDNIKEINKVSRVAGELAQLLRMHVFFIYYLDPNKHNREEYLADDEAKWAYNVVTNAIKQYLVNKIIKNRLSKFNCESLYQNT